MRGLVPALRHRVGTFALVLVVASGVIGTANALADTGPYATVYNSAGEEVGRWGAFFGAEPGTQIQLAENYAECGKTTACAGTPSTPLYPTIKLESGVYHLLKAYGSEHPIGGPDEGAGPWCEGIFAYSGVTLEGSAGTEIGNNITGQEPCAAANPNLKGLHLSSVVYVGAAPGTAAEPDPQGDSLKIAGIEILAQTPSGEGPSAEYGLFAGNISGAGLSVYDTRETEGTQASLLIGNEVRPVSGTASSPVSILDNTIEDSPNEGIVVDGTHMNIAGNHITETTAHAIAGFGPTVEYVEVDYNVIKSSSWGISFDGSYEVEKGRDTLGRENSAYSNTIEETCIGIMLYRQVDDYVAGNTVTDPYTGWKPTKGAQGCPERTKATVGVTIVGSYDNFVWSNRLFEYEYGVEVNDAGSSPGGVGTHWNYIGREPDWGQPWPWPVAGNWIEKPLWGFFVYSSAKDPSAVSENEFVGNAIDNYTRAMWDFETGASELTSENT